MFQSKHTKQNLIYLLYLAQIAFINIIKPMAGKMF